MPKARAALGIALAAMLLAGCGSSAEEDYGDEFTEVAQPLNVELVDLGNAVGSASSRQQVSAALERAKVALETASEGFAALDPPGDEAADAQEVLVNAIGAFVERIEETREALRDGNDREAGEAVADFSAESQAFAAALGEIGQRLEDAGIPLGEPEGTG